MAFRADCISPYIHTENSIGLGLLLQEGTSYNKKLFTTFLSESFESSVWVFYI
jgi:hypothetical protein